MAIIRSDSPIPEWSELEDFEIIDIKGDDIQTFSKKHDREIYVVASGMPVFTFGEYQENQVSVATSICQNPTQKK